MTLSRLLPLLPAVLLVSACGGTADDAMVRHDSHARTVERRAILLIPAGATLSAFAENMLFSGDKRILLDTPIDQAADDKPLADATGSINVE